MFLWVIIISVTLLLIVFSVERFIIPRLNPDNRFVKWWTKHMFSVDPFEK